MKKRLLAVTAAAMAGTMMSLPVYALPTRRELVESYLESDLEGPSYGEIFAQAGEKYGISPYLLQAISERESMGIPDVKNGNCIGLMQVNGKIHKERMERLKVDDLTDPYGNIFVAADYLAELYEKYEDTGLVLMLYSMKSETAFNLYEKGVISNYAKGVSERAAELEEKNGK